MNYFQNFGLTAAIVYGAIFLIWLVHFKLKDASIIDLFWGAGFGITACTLYCFTVNKTAYITLVAALPSIWAIRYSFFIWKRNLGSGEDDRYTLLREQTAAKNQSWFFVSLGVYIFQATSMFIVAIPIVIGISSNQSTSINLLAIIGVIIWIIGFLFETIADAQLEAFKKEHKNYNGPYETKPLMNQGLWKYSRHPNYFGNACMWWGIAIIVLNAHYGWLGIIGALYMNIALVFFTGKANNEEKMKNRVAYNDYIKKTSGFFPLPPKS